MRNNHFRNWILVCFYLGVTSVSFSKNIESIWNAGLERPIAQNLLVLGDSNTAQNGASSNMASQLELSETIFTTPNATVTDHRSDPTPVNWIFDPSLFDNGVLAEETNDVVIIYLGNNDHAYMAEDSQETLEDYFTQLSAALDQLIEAGFDSSRILLSTPFAPDSPDANEGLLWNLIHDLSQAYNCVFIDEYTTDSDQAYRHYLSYQNIKLTEPQKLRDEADYTNKVWCDLDASVDGDGSYFSPRNSYFRLDHQTDSIYLLKRGTEETVPTDIDQYKYGFSHDDSTVGVSAYGTGSKPILRSNGFSIYSFEEVANSLVKNIHFSGTYTGDGNGFIRGAQDAQLAYCEIGDPDSLPDHLVLGRFGNGVIHYNEISYCNNDAVNILGSDVTVTYNYIHHANQGALVEGVYFTGDGIQMEGSSLGNFDFRGLCLANNIIDRSDTYCKFCFILNGNSGTSGPINILNNTFMSPLNSEHGGAVCYVAADEPTGSIFNGNLMLNADMIGLRTWNGVFESIANNALVGSIDDLATIAVDLTNEIFTNTNDLHAYIGAHSNVSFGAMTAATNLWNPGSDQCDEMSLSGIVSGAQISLNVTGGTPPYNYLWSHGEALKDVTNLDNGSYRVLVSDVHGCKKQAFFEVTAGNTPNNAPIVSPVANPTIAAGADAVIFIDVMDPDGDPITLYQSNTRNYGSDETLEEISPGRWRFTWTNIPVDHPWGGVFESHLVIFKAWDGKEASEAEYVDIYLDHSGEPINQIPTISAISNQTVNYGETVTFNVEVNDDDLTDTLSLTPTSLPAGATLTNQASRTWTFSWQTDVDDVGSHDVTFTANDGTVDSSPVVVGVEVNDPSQPTNQAPVISAIADQTITNGETFSFDVIVTDADPADVITLTPSSLPTGATLTNQGNRIWAFSWQTDTNDIGSHSVTFTANDGTVDSNGAEVILLVNASSPNPSTAQNIKVWGDSISFGSGATSPAVRYSSLLANWLSVNETNLSISGSTLTDQTGPPLWKSDYMFSHYEADLLTGRADDYVMIFLGTNEEEAIQSWDTEFNQDVLDDFESHLDTILSALIAYGYAPARIIIGTPYYHGQELEAQAALRLVIQTVASEYNAIFVDFWTETGGIYPNYAWVNDYLSDGVHPNDLGHNRLFEITRDAILAAQPSYETWAAAYPEGARDPADMPDNDGIPNLIKYTAGLEAGMAHPTTNLFSSFLQTNQSSSTELVLTYHKAPEVIDAQLYAIQSGSLTNPVSSWTTNRISATATGNTDAEGRVEWKVVLPCTDAAGFMRLQAERVE